MNDKLLKEEILRIKILSEYSTKKTSSENISKFIKEQSDVKVPLKPPAETKKTDDSYKTFYDPNKPKYYNPTVSEETNLDSFYLFDKAKTMIRDLGEKNPKITSEIKDAVEELKEHLSSVNRNELSEEEFREYYSYFEELQKYLSDLIYNTRKLYPEHELTYMERLEAKDPEVMKHGYLRGKSYEGSLGRQVSTKDLKFISEIDRIDFGPWQEKNGDNYIYFINEKGDPIRQKYEGNGGISHFNALYVYPKDTTRILRHDDYYLITGDYEPQSTEEEWYLSSCSEPTKAIIPPTDKKTGLSGIDLIRAVNGYEETDSTGQPMLWCAYPYKKNQWIWIPNNSYVSFWDIDSVSKWAKKWVSNRHEWGEKKFGKNPDWNVWNEKDVAEDLGRQLNFGSVESVLVGGQWYYSLFKWDTGGPLTMNRVWDAEVQLKQLTYVGIYEDMRITKTVNKNAKPLPEPVWKDPRNPVEKFLDDFGLAIQIGVSIALFIVAIISEFGPGTQPVGLILAEIAMEMLIGVPLGIRSLQKGDNIGGAMSMLLSMTSWLKLGNIIKGFKGGDLRSLAKKLAESGLSGKPDEVAEWVLFYNNKLNEQEQMAFKYFFMNPDGMTQRRIRAALIDLKDTVLSEPTMIKRVGKLLLDNGEIKSIPFIKSFTTKELGLQGALLGLGLATGAYFGEDLNDEQKKWAEDIHGTIPPELRDKWVQNMMFNGFYMQENLKDLKDNLIPQNQLEMAKNDILKYYNTEIVNTVTENKGTAVEDEKVTVGTSEKQNLTKTDVEKMKQEGWMTRDDPKWRELLLQGKKIKEIIYTYLDEPYNKLYKMTK